MVQDYLTGEKHKYFQLQHFGKISEEQKLDGLDEEESKRYMHHYNFPGFSVGEAKPSRGARKKRNRTPEL